MRLIIVVFVCSLVFACGVIHRKIIGPNGNIGYTLHCPGTNKVAQCYNKAHELCPNGYEELKTQTYNSISIECKEPKE
jgi:hypothetical protein